MGAADSHRALRQLIASIESWPAATASYRSQTPSPPRKRASALAPLSARPLALKGLAGGSLGARPTKLPAMASAVPQRAEEWRHKCVGPALGPGVYSASHVLAESLRTIRPERRSPAFASKVRRPGGFGALNGRGKHTPNSYYAHNSDPAATVPPANGGRSFRCILDRFDGTEYLRSLSLQQRPPPQRRVSPYYHGAPVWDAAFDAAYAPLLADDDHAYRLAKARANAQTPAMPRAPPPLSPRARSSQGEL